MARSRNIKPSFFNNDELAEIEPLGRLLFIGLWTIADCNGNFEWREKRIKAQLLPYDNCNVKKIAINLDNSGFIRFYSNQGKIYANITNFTKHQNPHKNERDKGTEIPDFTECARAGLDISTLTINLDNSGLKRNDSDSNRADSFNLIPDSFNPDPDPLNAANQNATSANDLLDARFEKFWSIYPNRKDKAKAKAVFKKIKPDDIKFQKILRGLNSQIEWRKNANGNFRPEWKLPTTWLNGENWEDEIATDQDLNRFNSTTQQNVNMLANLDLDS